MHIYGRSVAAFTPTERSKVADIFRSRDAVAPEPLADQFAQAQVVHGSILALPIRTQNKGDQGRDVSMPFDCMPKRHLRTHFVPVLAA